MAWIQISNLSSRTTEQDLATLFSFCGAINQITLEPYQASSGTLQIACLEFTEADSLVTALLLHETLLLERPIHVQELSGFSGTNHKPTPQISLLENTLQAEEDQLGPIIDLNVVLAEQREPPQIEPTGAIIPPQINVEQEMKSATRTELAASIVAAGYTIGYDAMQKAKDFDQQHLNVAPVASKKVDEALDSIKSKAIEIDDEYRITQKIDAEIEKIRSSDSFKDASKKLQEIDDKFQISGWVNRFMSDVQLFEEQTKREIEFLERKKEQDLLQQIEAQEQLAIEGEVKLETPTFPPPINPLPEPEPSRLGAFVQDSVEALQTELLLRSTDPDSKFFSFLSSLSKKDPETESEQTAGDHQTNNTNENPEETATTEDTKSKFFSFLQSLTPHQTNNTNENQEETATTEEPKSKFFSFLQSLSAPKDPEEGKPEEGKPKETSEETVPLLNQLDPEDQIPIPGTVDQDTKV